MPLEEQLQYYNQKGILLQNVLIVCNFDIVVGQSRLLS